MWLSGRAFALHVKGPGFDPRHLHYVLVGLYANFLILLLLSFSKVWMYVLLIEITIVTTVLLMLIFLWFFFSNLFQFWLD